MFSLIAALLMLIIGYFVWGKLTDKAFSPDDRKTPALAIHDGVDCVPIPTWKVFLIQILNIAGTGPIFGALMGAVFGPIVFLWIVFGSILGGAVHDYMTGMISSRHEGKSIAELSGIYLGRGAKWFMRFFTVVLLILCGTVFVTSSSELLANLTTEALNRNFWFAVILVYYVAATVSSVDKVIARVYPMFGVVFLVMALGILGGLFFGGYTIPEVTLRNLHPDQLPVWPFMFVTVACGAISGFHATQSPMAAKCITSERAGRKVFYGAMIGEAVIALAWAAAGVAFYGTSELLQKALASAGQSGVVYEIATTLLGKIGGLLAVFGVILCPITSGDTAFRAARLTLAEWTGLDQRRIVYRLLLALPIFAAAIGLSMIDFNALWRYFSWSNQTLATVALWTATAYLIKHGRGKASSLLTALPATFMTAVCSSYILMASEGFGLPSGIGYPIGIGIAAVLCALYLVNLRRYRKHSAV